MLQIVALKYQELASFYSWIIQYIKGAQGDICLKAINLVLIKESIKNIWIIAGTPPYSCSGRGAYERG
jgi:hypothetical protein